MLGTVSGCGISSTWSVVPCGLLIVNSINRLRVNSFHSSSFRVCKFCFCQFTHG